jgi:hypothetical protein
MTIGGLTLPLQPVIEVRMGRNWILTDVVGSAGNDKISGTQVKENMGRSDTVITVNGILMTTGSTIGQYVGIEGGAEDKDTLHWADKVRQIVALFDEEEAVPIVDWLPMELADNDIRQLANDRTPGRLRIHEQGFSLFEVLGIQNVVLLSFEIYEREGMERKFYTLRLQEDRNISLEDLTPYEEAQA